MTTNLEPIVEKRSTSDQEIQSYTSYELDLLVKDIDQLRHFQLYHPECSLAKASKKNKLAFEPKSPFFFELLQARDWDALATEIATNGMSSQELSALTTTVVECIYFGDFDSTDRLFTQLRLQQVARGCRITSSTKEYASRELNIQSISENISFLLFDHDLTVEQRRSKMSEYLDQTDAFISSQSQSTYQNIQKNKCLKKRLMGHSLPSMELQLRSDFHKFLHRRIASVIRTMISSFNNSLVLFPDLVSGTLSHLSIENFDDDYGETIESVKNNLLVQYQSSRTGANQAIRVLSHLDPTLALVETMADPIARSEVVEEIMSTEPSLSGYLIDLGFISQSEIDQLGGYATVNPNFYLSHYAELTSSELEIDMMLSNAIPHASIARILSVSQDDELILRLIIEKPELHEYVSSQLKSLILTAPVPLTAAAFVSSCRLGNLEGLQEIYMSLTEKEVLTVRSELLSKFDLHNQEIVDDIMGFGDTHHQYLKIIKQRLSHLPNELQFAISLSVICCPGQSSEICEEISEGIYSYVIGYQHRNKLSKPLRSVVASNIVSSWGRTNSSIFLILQTVYDTDLHHEPLQQVCDYISSAIDSHLQQEPDYRNDDYWSENRLIALLIDSGFDTLEPSIKEKIILLLEKDGELLDLVLTYEEMRPEGYSELISDQLAETVILAKNDVKTKLKYLILLKAGRSNEFINSVFQEIQHRHPVMAIVSSLYQYQCLIAIFQRLPITVENLMMAIKIEAQLSHVDRRYIAEHAFTSSGSFEKQVGSLMISKFLQSNGISEADSIGWAARVCRKYQDRNYDSLLDENVLQRYEKIDRYLYKHRLEFAEFILENPSINWEIGAPSLIDLIIGNEPSDIKEFLDIFSHKLNLSLTQEQVLHKLFELKDLRQGKLARRSLICGLLELSSCDGGVEAVGRLLESSDLSKDDPKRLRTILRMRGWVNVPEIVSQNQGKLLQIKQVVMTRVSDILSVEIGMPLEHTAELSANIEYFISSGLMGAYVALSKRYSQLEDPRTLDVLKQAVGHMLAGDFSTWRNSHGIAAQQLSLVSEKAASTWRQAQEIEQIQALPETVAGLIKTVQSAMFDLVSHLPFDIYAVESELNNCLAKIETSPDDTLLKEQHQRLSRKKEVADLIIKIRKYDLFLYSKENLIHLVRVLFHHLEDISATQSSQDAGELLRLLSLTKPFETGETLTVSDADDPVQLINSGVFPRETCQSWRQGIYNECLVSTLCDVNTRMLVVTDSDGQVVGRTLMKLLPLQTNLGEEFPAIVLETIYTLRNNSAIEKVILKAALKKARASGLSLVFDEHCLIELIENDPEFSGIIFESIDLQLAEVNPTGEFGYSDVFGGLLKSGQTPREPRLLYFLTFLS